MNEQQLGLKTDLGEPPLCQHSPVVGLWASHLLSLGLSFLIWKVGTM